MIVRNRKNNLLTNLDFIKNSYLNLLLLKQLEYDVIESASYENLHELSENERRIIEDINGTLKYIVPDLVYFREDQIIKERVSEIDRLQTSLIQKNIKMRKEIKDRLDSTKKCLDNLNTLPKSSGRHLPNIVNLRA